MPAKKISQRDARQLRKDNAELKGQMLSMRRVWGQEYRGVNIASRVYTADVLPDVVRVARKLGHAVVVVGDDSDTLRFVALPHPKEPV